VSSEGCTITKKKETPPIDSNYTCPNPSCGKPFVKPLKTINLRLENPEPYLACPHCLAEIIIGENPQAQETRPTSTMETAETPETPENPRGKQAEERTTWQRTKPHCNHHLGYLSQRAAKEKMPEECITCPDILTCMLKTVKNQPEN